MKKLLLLTTAGCLLAVTVIAQTKNTVLTADSLATGNYKDVLNSFFQLALNRFTSPDKELKFTSNPYAIMAKMNPDLWRTKQYKKYKYLRRLNFAFAGKLDTAYRFNGFSSGLKYALIDRRDETVSDAFLIEINQDPFSIELDSLVENTEAFMSMVPPDQQSKLRSQITDFYDGKVSFGQLDSRLQEQFRKIAREKSLTHILPKMETDTGYNIRKDADARYAALKKNFNNRFLWTAGVSDTTYKDQFMFSNVVFTTEAVQGLLNTDHQANIEYNIKAAYQMIDDTLKAGRDLKRGILNAEGGFNFILNAKDTDRSFLEFKLAASYYYKTGSLYQDEKRDMLTVNGTLRIRVFNDIWIPLEIKYEPKKGNWFGFLNVRANFQAIGGKK